MRSTRRALQGKDSNVSFTPLTLSSGFKAAGPQGAQRSAHPQSGATGPCSTSWHNPNPRARQLSRLGLESHPPSPILENKFPQGSSGAGEGDGWRVDTPKVKSRVGSHISRMTRAGTNRTLNRSQAADASKPYGAFPVDRTRLDVNGTSSQAPSAISRMRNGESRTPLTSSYLKQSALPVSERDPELYEIEKNEGARVNKNSFRPGMIFRAVIHEPLADRKAAKGGKGRTESNHGPICTKYRKLIVIGIYEDHVVALPIYTHNGEGLNHKLNPDEYVSIRDPRTGVSAEDFRKESKHKPIVARNLNPDTELYHPKAVVHFTHPYSFEYSWKMIPEGVLEGISFVELKALHDRYPSGMGKRYG
ncbi:MAG: hypothetical protein M1836_008201 [Candelina mexicana]|nr:MAG: hypothetical protein M1836_008201 [Candelina mexicana]